MGEITLEADEFDQASRYVPESIDVGVLACLWPDASRSRRFTRWLDTDISGFPGEPERRCDNIAEFVSFDGLLPPVAAIAESMSGPTLDMLLRFAEYCLRLQRLLVYQRNPTVPYQVVCGIFLLTGKAPAEELVTVVDDFGYECRVRFRILALQELDAEVILQQIASNEVAWGMLAYLSLMKNADKPSVIEDWKRAVETVAHAKSRGDIRHLALMFSQLSNRKNLWQQQMEGWNMKVRSEVVVEIEQRSELRATLRAGRAAIVRLLKHRLGKEIPPTIPAALELIEDKGRLDDLLIAASDTASLAAFEQLLAK